MNSPAYELELGTHDIQVQVIDAAGNSAAATATYTIAATAESLSVLTEKFVEGEGEEGVSVSLLEKLEKGNYHAYINEVSALSGNKITEERAAALIRFAKALMEG
ncbi:hypothetical protein SD71_21155 [Cohnella kolymensis]|uniref:Uncharacterized protein n=1 Tax=Cohnella kolymensis TaxID=1590652 RepID=A0ABR4ZZR9_9BACL|nr:hypothetical protein [Cohnella kolymensis]KIL34177.1 hypothetical protein SD71_21155 [Cohnella kolymensis]